MGKQDLMGLSYGRVVEINNPPILPIFGLVLRVVLKRACVKMQVLMRLEYESKSCATSGEFYRQKTLFL